MKKIFNNLAIYIFVGMSTLCIFIPLSYWIAHPEETQMQVFMKFFYLYIITIAFGIINYIRELIIK